MQLILFRHGIAEDFHPEGDPARELTDTGGQKVLKMARFLFDHIEVDGMISSPYARAIQTASLVADTYSYPKNQIIQSQSLTPSANPEIIIHELNSSPFNNVFIFGHNPHLSLLGGYLLGCHSGIDMKKASVLWLECSKPIRPARAKLLGYYTVGALP